MPSKKESLLHEEIDALSSELETRDSLISTFYHMTISVSMLLCLCLFLLIVKVIGEPADHRTLLCFLPLLVVWYSIRLRGEIHR